MKILGNRVLVSRVEEAKAEGFETVEVQDNFVYKGLVVQVGDGVETPERVSPVKVGDVILYAKYSPDTQEVEDKGVKYKVVLVSDILAVL